jgi:hypothetical protein
MPFTSSGSSILGSGGAVVASDLTVDGTTITVDEAADSVGIGTTTPGAKLEVQDTTTSTANTGGSLRLSANDGAPMGDSHRLGVLEFTGAEDSSNTQVVGARIEAITDAAWTNVENGCALYFYTTDGNASQTNVLKIDSNKKSTFAGDISATANVQLNSTTADEATSGITATFTAGEALERGEVVYFKAADSKMWKALATASATARCVAMAAEDIAADAAGVFLMQGFLEDNGTFPAYAIGGTLYTPEAETSGQNVPEQTAPDSDGDFLQVVGFAVTNSRIWFNPSSTLIEIA